MFSFYSIEAKLSSFESVFSSKMFVNQVINAITNNYIRFIYLWMRYKNIRKRYL
jgi:hypothetical protein